MKKLKIVQTPVRYYPHIGGVELVCKYLSEELVNQGHSVTVVCADEPHSEDKEINGVNIKKLPYPFKLTNTNITPSLPISLLTGDFDLIQTYIPTPWTCDWSVIIAKLKNKKSVIYIQNDLDKPGFIPGLITSFYLNTFFRISLTLTDKIIVVNKDWKRAFVNTRNILKIHEKKITAIPNGISTEIFKPINVTREANSLIFVSVLDKYHEFKGLDYLLQAIQIVKKTIPNIKLTIVGEGELKAKYQLESKKMGLEKNIVFIGKADQAELPKLYSSASLFILPSTEIEGFGIVAIEALACGTPVVVSEIVGISEDVANHSLGKVVKPRDAAGLAQSVEELLGNPKLIQEMGQRGKKFVEDNYTWTKIANNINSVYQSLF